MLPAVNMIATSLLSKLSFKEKWDNLAHFQKASLFRLTEYKELVIEVTD